MNNRRRPSAIPPHAHSALMEASAIYSALPFPIRSALDPAASTLRSIARTDLPHVSASLPRLWALAKPSLFASGAGMALVYLVIGILVNHVRRTLAPWLGGDVRWAPLGDLKLALGSPDLFLGEILGGGWREGAFMVLQRMGVDVLGVLAVGVLVEDEAERERQRERQKAKDGEAKRKTESQGSVRLDVARIGTAVYLLTAAEYVHARTCHTLAVFLACVKSLVTLPKSVWGLGGGGTAAHKAAHWAVLRKAGWAARTALACRVVVYVMYGLGPMVIGAARGAAAGRMGMAGVMGATGWVTYVVTRWSNKYYMLLEMWGMVLVMGWAGVAGVVVLGEALGKSLV